MSGFAGTGVIPTVQTTQILVTLVIVTIIPKVDGDLGTNTFFRPSLGPMMTGTEHEMLTKFFTLMPPVFHGSEGEDGSSLSQITTRGFISWTLHNNTGWSL